MSPKFLGLHMRKSLRKSNARFLTILHDFGENFSFFFMVFAWIFRRKGTEIHR